MATLNEYEHFPNDTQFANLQSQINSMASQISETKNRLARYKQELEQAKKEEKIFTPQHIERLHKLIEAFPSNIQTYYRNELSAEAESIRLRVNGTRRRIEVVTNKVTRYEREKARLDAQLSSIRRKPSVTLNAADIRAKLKPNPHVSYFRINRDNNGVFVSWIFTGLVAKVTGVHTEPSYIALNKGSGNLHIPIGRSTVKVYLSDGATRIKPTNTDDGTSRHYWTERHLTTHPHVLTHYKPCFGDFGGPLREAIDEGDMITVVSIVQMFLQQIDSNDSAGSKWHRYDKRISRALNYVSLINSDSDMRAGKLVYQNGNIRDIYYGLTLSENGEISINKDEQFISNFRGKLISKADFLSDEEGGNIKDMRELDVEGNLVTTHFPTEASAPTPLPPERTRIRGYGIVDDPADDVIAQRLEPTGIRGDQALAYDPSVTDPFAVGRF